MDSFTIDHKKDQVIADLKKKNAELRKENAELRKRIEQLEQMVRDRLAHAHRHQFITGRCIPIWP